MDTYFQQQLDKLQTDYIDYYLLHAMGKENWANLRKNGVLAWMDKMKASGKVKHIGFSFHDKYPVFRKIVDAYPWDFCQIQFNYLDIREQAGRRGLDYAAAKGMGIIVMEPLRGGKLVTNIPPEVEHIWQKSALRLNEAERALHYVWNIPEVTLVLSGMSALEQVQENIRTASTAKANELSRKELNLYLQARKAYLAKAPLPCTGCEYCLPCPQGVSIPWCFGVYMDAFMFGDVERHKREYNFFVPDEHKADKCTACGACLSKCPQHINIPVEMAKVKAYLA